MFKKENLRKNFLRVKQIADQNLGRVEKTEVLSDDLQVSEKRVDTVKHVCSNTVKKVGASFLSTGSTDVEKRLKKMPEAGLGHSMIESATILGVECVMGQMYQMCGDCQSSLAQKHLQYELDVEKMVQEPLQDILELQIPQISKLKKALGKVTLDYDSARGRHQSAVRQTQTPGVNMVSASAKVDTLNNELEDSMARVEQAKDAYTTGLFNFISKEADHSKCLLELLEAQAIYHKQSLEIIENVIPKIRETLSCNPTKPVYGMTLEEHLRVTGRDIAVVIEACVCYLLEFGLEEEGLFRIAGMASKLKKLKASFDAGVVFEDIGELDPHTVAGALKQYLRELPEPLLTFNLFPDFMAAAQKQQEQRLQALWCVVDRLPKPNYDNFRYLVKFLAKLTEKSDVNKMSPGNIAIVIGPNLIWSEGDSGPNMMNTSILSLITELIVQHADWFFPGEVEFAVGGTQAGNGSPVQEHNNLNRTNSDQSSSSHGTPQSSPAYQEKSSPLAPPQTPPTASRSPSISPATSNPNLQGAPLAESEDMPTSLRRPVRKPAPPPPERPYSVAVCASIKPQNQNNQYQTWPRQAVSMVEEPTTINNNDKQKTLPPDRPALPERMSVHYHGHERPKIPPPVVPPGHQRSASTGAPVTIPGGPGSQLYHADTSPGSSSPFMPSGANMAPGTHGSNSQLAAQPQESHRSNSFSRQSTARPLRPMPPPPPPPDDIVEETHL